MWGLPVLLDYLLREYECHSGDILCNQTRRSVRDHSGGGHLVYICNVIIYVGRVNTSIIMDTGVVTHGKVITTTFADESSGNYLMLTAVIVAIITTIITITGIIFNVICRVNCFIFLTFTYIMLSIYTWCMIIITKINMWLTPQQRRVAMV